MATTFNVVYLGTTSSDIDPDESTTASDNMGVLVGTTFGGPAAPLYDDVQTLSPVGSPGTTYDNAYDPDQFPSTARPTTLTASGSTTPL